MIDIQGIGWITATAYGQASRPAHQPHEGLKSLHAIGQQQGLFAAPIKNFGRFNPDSQRILFSTSLALQDAGLLPRQKHPCRIGSLGHFDGGCLRANTDFFRDYMDGGRTLSRANLFIYTLPSSPLAEASIHFELAGPLLELQCGRPVTQELLQIAETLIRNGDADRMLVHPVGRRIGSQHAGRVRRVRKRGPANRHSVEFKRDHRALR